MARQASLSWAFLSTSFSAPSVSWPSSFSFSLRIPGQILPVDVGFWGMWPILFVISSWTVSCDALCHRSLLLLVFVLLRFGEFFLNRC